METGREHMFEGAMQESRGTFRDMEGRADRAMGRTRFNFGRLLSRFEGTRESGLLGGLLAFSLTVLAASMLFFPGVREGLGRRTGLYKPERPIDRVGNWITDLGHRIGLSI